MPSSTLEPAYENHRVVITFIFKNCTNKIVIRTLFFFGGGEGGFGVVTPFLVTNHTAIRKMPGSMW